MSCIVAGMSTIHEVLTARHAGITVLAFSLITNVCATEHDPVQVNGGHDLVQEVRISRFSPAMPRGQTSEASLAEWHCVVGFLLEGWGRVCVCVGGGGVGLLQHTPPYRPGHANSQMASTSPVAQLSPNLQA